MTVGEYLDTWLKGSVYGSVRRSTYDRDTNLVNNHIKPGLGGLKLKKLNSAHVQSFYRDRLDAGLSASTVHKIHDILRRALAQAVKWHLVPRNVADVVKPPRPVPKEMVGLSADEAQRLLQAAGGDRLEALYTLAIHTGMRQGEMLALRWQDVDLKNAVVSVRRTLTRRGGKAAFGEPKTKKSRRSIPLRSEEHTSELQSRQYLVCRLLLEKKNNPARSQRYPVSSPSVVSLLSIKSCLSACALFVLLHNLLLSSSRY